MNLENSSYLCRRISHSCSFRIDIAGYEMAFAIYSTFENVGVRE